MQILAIWWCPWQWSLSWHISYYVIWWDNCNLVLEIYFDVVLCAYMCKNTFLQIKAFNCAFTNGLEIKYTVYLCASNTYIINMQSSSKKNGNYVHYAIVKIMWWTLTTLFSWHTRRFMWFHFSSKLKSMGCSLLRQFFFPPEETGLWILPCRWQEIMHCLSNTNSHLKKLHVNHPKIIKLFWFQQSL